jgi:hypothetical protein
MLQIVLDPSYLGRKTFGRSTLSLNREKIQFLVDTAMTRFIRKDCFQVKSNLLTDYNLEFYIKLQLLIKLNELGKLTLN